MQARLEKLRVKISEWELIRDLATEKDKPTMIASLVQHRKILVDQFENEIAGRYRLPTRSSVAGRESRFRKRKDKPTSQLPLIAFDVRDVNVPWERRRVHFILKRAGPIFPGPRKASFA
jgi:hypothetical protein